MSSETQSPETLLTEINDTITQLVETIYLLDENKINRIPYENSWTAAQLIDHITKSANTIARAMKADGIAAERNIAERVVWLKELFLDFSTKMKSPGEIVPGNGPFKKENVINELKGAFATLKLNTAEAELSQLVENLPFGPATKYELMHFVLYHTQRHLHQLKRIYAALPV